MIITLVLCSYHSNQALEAAFEAKCHAHLDRGSVGSAPQADANEARSQAVRVNDWAEHVQPQMAEATLPGQPEQSTPEHEVYEACRGGTSDAVPLTDALEGQAQTAGLEAGADPEARAASVGADIEEGPHGAPESAAPDCKPAVKTPSKMIFGGSEEAARGLKVFVGLNNAQVISNLLVRDIESIQDEFIEVHAR